MAWTDGANYSTGQLITSTIWNNYLGEAGNIDLTAPGVVTAAGDTVYATGDNTITRLGKGTARQTLAMNSGATAPEWAASSRSVLTTAGDVMYASGTNTPARLGKGAARENLTMNSGATAPEWTASPASLLTAEGDILYASAANTVARLAKGDDDDTLVMNGNVPNWEAVAAAGGLTEADSYALTVGFTDDAQPIDENLDRLTTDGFGLLGTGMSESSGIFTFPSTGYWAVLAMFDFRKAGDSDYNWGRIMVSVNADGGNTYSNVSCGASSMTQYDSANMMASAMCFSLVNVTAVAAVKVRFDVVSRDAATTLNGGGGYNSTSFHFLKLADL